MQDPGIFNVILVDVRLTLQESVPALELLCDGDALVVGWQESHEGRVVCTDEADVGVASGAEFGMAIADSLCLCSWDEED